MACSDPKTGKLIGSYELGLLSGEEKSLFESHLLGCDACFEDLYRMSPVAGRLREGEAAPEGEMDLSAESGEADERRATGVRPTARSLFPMNWPYLAAAAAVVVVVLLGVRFLLPGGEGERLRGTDEVSILVFSPVGEVPPPGELQWKTVPGSSSYRVRILTEGGEIVWEATVDEPPALLPALVRESLRTGGTYFWEVEARADDGTRWESGPTRFTIRQ
jgi:hypothetical protein